ncbi:MAG: DUF2769 domain-containing protein [Deltaproteobacteria bacterium]|nr:DUF2769 domain-containing protein [Deltaproteobacteria bacterium]
MDIASFDRFGVEELSKEEYAAKEAGILEECLCATCPTYVAGDAPKGYCFPVVGTSDKIKVEKDCVCGGCSVFKEFKLTHNHYCTRCSQLCQTYKTEAGGGHE